MDFYQKYELLDLLKDEGVKVFNARETATGRRITVFLFVGDQARLQADLLEQLRASQRPGRPDLLEVGDAQGTPFVATAPVGGLADLKRMAVAAPAGKPPDAFTKVGVWHIPGPTAPAPAPVAPARGEFTGLFQAAAPPQPMGEAASPAPPAQSAPGEFTRLFQAAAPPQPMGEAAPPAARPPAPPAQSAPGEFTRLFQAATPPQPIGEAKSPAAPPAPPGPPAAGEFTRFFQAPLSPPPPAAPAPGEFTRIFGRGDLPAASVPAGPPASPAGPGEYTRLFSAQPVVPPAPGPAPAPAAAPMAARKVPWLTVALAAAVVVLLAVVVVMALALRK